MTAKPNLHVLERQGGHRVEPVPAEPQDEGAAV